MSADRNSKSSEAPTPAKLRAEQNILFVCIGNACRSQMAEGFANHDGDGRVRAWSAGSMPLGMIAEGTEAVMAEKGIFLEGHFSKGVNEVPLKKMDVIVTMGCGMPCPTFPGFRGRKVEWEIPDPYGHSLKYFRQVRDLLEGQVRALLETLPAQVPSDALHGLLRSRTPKPG